MRVYVPVGWALLKQLQESGGLDGPQRGCAVDPAWRAGAPEVDEEEWEYEAAQQAAESLDSDGGLVLAVDLDEAFDSYVDGWVTVPGPVRRRQVGAVLDAELAWFGLQELGGLLAEARP